MPRNKGFTIIELLIVLIIMGILATILISRFTDAKGQALQRAQQSSEQCSRIPFKMKIMGDNIVLHSLEDGNYVVWLEYKYPTASIPDYVVKFQKQGDIRITYVKKVVSPMLTDSADLNLSIFSGNTIVIPVFTVDLKVSLWYSNELTGIFTKDIGPYLTSDGYWVIAGSGGTQADVLDGMWVFYLDKSVSFPKAEADSFEEP